MKLVTSLEELSVQGNAIVKTSNGKKVKVDPVSDRSNCSITLISNDGTNNEKIAWIADQAPENAEAYIRGEKYVFPMGKDPSNLSFNSRERVFPVMYFKYRT